LQNSGRSCAAVLLSNMQVLNGKKCLELCGSCVVCGSKFGFVLYGCLRNYGLWSYSVYCFGCGKWFLYLVLWCVCLIEMAMSVFRNSALKSAHKQ